MKEALNSLALPPGFIRMLRSGVSMAGEVGLGRPDDLMAAIGYGKFSARQMLARLAPSSAVEPTREAAPEEKPGGLLRRVFGGESGAITVKGHDDLLVYRARCCNPIRGEEIVGYVTRGKGVAVHAKSCPNVVNLMYESDRRIDVEWAKTEKTAAPVIRSSSPCFATIAAACSSR